MISTRTHAKISWSRVWFFQNALFLLTFMLHGFIDLKCVKSYINASFKMCYVQNMRRKILKSSSWFRKHYSNIFSFMLHFQLSTQAINRLLLHCLSINLLQSDSNWNNTFNVYNLSLCYIFARFLWFTFSSHWDINGSFLSSTLHKRIII